MNASGTASTGRQPVAGPVTTAALMIAAVIAMAETDRLIEGAITPDGASRSLAEVVGPAAVGGRQRDAWTVWGRLPEPALVPDWVGIHVLLDLLFVAGYALLLRRVLVSTAPMARRFLWVLVGLEVIEASLLLASAEQLRAAGVADWLAWTVAVVATVKWAAVAGLLVAALRSRDLRQRTGEALRRTGRALWVQRLSLIVVVVIATLSLVPLPNIWDQLPDAQRGWVGSAAKSAPAAGESAHPVRWAFVSMTAVAIALFFLGRRRAERAWATRVTRQVPKQRAVYWWWLVGPVAAAVGAVVLRLRGRDDLVDGRTVAIFIIVPVALVACSWGLRQRGESRTRRQRWVSAATGLAGAFAFAVAVANLLVERDHRTLIAVLIAVMIALALLGLVVWWRERRGRRLWAQEQTAIRDLRRALDVVRAGDVLALAVVVVAGLGLVRSFTAPFLLQETVVSEAAQAALLGLGILLILLAPLGGERLVAWLDAGPVPAGSGVVASVRRSLRPSYPGWLPARGGRVSAGFVTLAVCGAAILVLGSLAVHPTGLTAELGVVATAEAALGGWAVILGFLIVHLQHRRPLEVFRLFHLRADPVITLLAVSLLTVSLAGGDPDLHAVRAAGGSAAQPGRPGLGEAFGDWVARSGTCDRTVTTPDGVSVRIRPMVLVAASGGGIRATVWTAGALNRLARAGSCGPTAVMLSSGVSGGSLGLVLARAPGASERAERLAGPEALNVAVAGTIVGDPVAALTGLRWPAHGERLWRDRAALMETVWEGQDPLLATAYNAEVGGPAGALVLNSAAANLHCRVLVSQIDLGGSDRGPTETTDPAAPADCRARTGLPAASLDLHIISCSPSMSWATAAMLSARFPTVTPAGRLPRCDGGKDLQLVDGGYAEGSGVGTLADLAPRVAQEVREHNTRVSARGGAFVVPIVVYLEDETRAELEVRMPDLAPELFVPISGLGAADRMAASGTWIQRAADAFADPCPRDGQLVCTAAVAHVRERLPGGVVVVAPVTRPSIDAPLGWTLSRYSLDRLDKALDDQMKECRRIQRYGCLKDLAAFLEGRAD